MSKAEAARVNGAKSKGPTTSEGKARSAQNSLKHGLNSNIVVLASESLEEYEELLADYVRLYQPAGAVEWDLVNEIASTRWRLRRILRIEAAAFDAAIERAAEEDPDNPASEGIALESLAEESGVLRMLNRYEGRLRRSYERALSELRRIQAERIASTQIEPLKAVPNEPKPDPTTYKRSSVHLPPPPMHRPQKERSVNVDPGDYDRLRPLG